jgi:hypothetical protein
MGDLCNAGVVKEVLRVGPDGNPGTARTAFHRAGRRQTGVRGPQLFQSEITGHYGLQTIVNKYSQPWSIVQNNPWQEHQRERYRY